MWKWVTWIWLHWYVALRAEAAVLAGSPDAADRLAEARTIVAGNPVAGAIVERAAGAARRRPASGCSPRRTRSTPPAAATSRRGPWCSPAATHAARGAAALADLGLAPMGPGWY